MLVNVQDKGFSLDYMNEDDLRSLRSIIKGSALPDRRNWHGVLQEINTILREK